MKLEPFALSAHMTDAQIYAGLFECDALERVGYSEEMLQVVRRLIDSAIPEGYVVVPVEATEEWIANMRKGTIEPQGMDAQAKIIEGLRRNYKRWIAAAKEQS